MKRLRSKCISLVLVLLTGGTSAYASGIAFIFDLPVVPFQYVAAAGPNGKVGTITISHGAASNLLGQKLDLGADATIGGGGLAADTAIDQAKISLASNFNSSLQGDVYKLGTNSYKIQGTLQITDVSNDLSAAPVQASFLTNTVSLGAGFFSFDADLTAITGNDAILQPGPLGTWAFMGVAGDTPAAPDQDATLGQVSLASGRTDFNQGTCSGGYYTSARTMDLDTFFGSNRSSISVDVKAIVTPEPSSLSVMAIFALLGLGRKKRRA